MFQALPRSFRENCAVRANYSSVINLSIAGVEADDGKLSGQKNHKYNDCRSIKQPFKLE